MVGGYEPEDRFDVPGETWSDYKDEADIISDEELRKLEMRDRTRVFMNSINSKGLQNLKTSGVLNNKFVIAGTGSSSFSNDNLNAAELDTIASLERAMAVNLRKWGERLIILSGGAIGWDFWMTAIARKLGIPYVLSIPNEGYGNYYWGKARQIGRYIEMFDNALEVEFVVEDVYGMTGLYIDGVHSNFVRNNRMVNLADAFFVYDTGSPGTRHCFKSIIKRGIPYRSF